MAFSRPYNPPIPLSDITGLGSAAEKDAPISGDAASGEVVLGSDTRLTDSRTPTSHNHAASEITSGTVATARLGSGTADSTTYLRGDQTWATISGGGASAIDDLTDVTITAAASGNFLRHNGTAWVNAAISASDIPSGVDRTKIGNGIDVVETFCYKQSSSVDYNGTSGAWTIEPADLQITVPSTGLWQITALVNVQKASTGASTAIRLAMNTAVISGTTGWPAGGHYSAAVTGNCTITTGSPTIVSGASRSPGSNDICFAITWNLNVTTAGTIKVQMSDGSATSNIFKLLNTSTIVGKRLSA